MENDARIEALIDDFTILDDWEDRYTHLIEMGKNLAPLSATEKSDANKVSGCTSQVWIVADRDGEALVFRGDSDAHIVKGLIAVVLEILSGRTPDEIAKIDIITILDTLGLKEHLSSQRANGLRAMINQILKLASAAQMAPEPSPPAPPDSHKNH